MATPQLSPGVLVREVDLTKGRVDNVLDNITAEGSPIKASMQRDVEKNAFTEHEEIFGHLISKAQNYNFDSRILTSCYLKMKLYYEKLI